MIIRTLRSENILKYRRLEIDGLPEKGLIAISGDNESGKTAIVETACYALFGRTFSLTDKNITKVIRWGEVEGSVELTFTAKDGLTYNVSRHIDSEARQSARLQCIDGEEVVAVAKGLSPVLNGVTDLCGFDYAEFVDSLYLAQQDTTTVHPLSTTAKAITGVTAMEKTVKALVTQVAQEQQAIADAQIKLGEAENSLKSLGFDENILASLESKRAFLNEVTAKQELVKYQDRLRHFQDAVAKAVQDVEQISEMSPSTTKHEGWRQKVEDLEGIAESVENASAMQSAPEGGNTVTQPIREFVSDLRDRLAGYEKLIEQANALRERLLFLVGDQERESDDEQPLPKRIADVKNRIRKGSGVRGRNWLLALIFLLLAVVGWGIWLPIVQMPNSALGQAEVQWISENITPWDSKRHGLWVLGASVFFLIFLFWFLTRATSASSRVVELVGQREELGNRSEVIRQHISELTDLDKITIPEALNIMERMDDEALTQSVEQFRANRGQPLAAEESADSYKTELKNSMDSMTEAAHAYEHTIESKIETLVQSKDEHSSKVNELETEITSEQQRKHTAQELKRVIHDIGVNISNHAHGIKVRELGCELLSGASRQALEYFNRDLRVFMSRVMPQLTRDRYHYLQLDPDMNVTVFSADKHDFVGWEEISTGTRQQVLLALRLALSAALAEATAGEQAQFVILDEPFAFYDATLIQNGLDALPKTSDKLTQIWVISQEFSSDDPFALHIRCDVDRTELALAG